MTNGRGRRLALVVGSQCATAPSLSFLPALAHDLAQVLIDPRLGDCRAALDSAALIDPSRALLIASVRDAFAAANSGDDPTTLVLAFLGHGIPVDEDFYFLPYDGPGTGRHDGDVFLSHVLKEELRASVNLDGLLVLLDTCYAGVGAAEMAKWQEVGLGRHKRRYEILTASAAQPAHGGKATKALVKVLREGMPVAGTTLDSRYLHQPLMQSAGSQRPQRITHDGGGWRQAGDDGMWWAHNVAHYSVAAGHELTRGDGAIARSAYHLQIQRIAPPELIGRERELAELAAYCTAEQASPYVWWRAPAWAGKSALMAYFALHRPPGTRLVSFFITARFAGQSDRIAFIDVVMEQLAEIVEQPLPVLTEATREPTFLRLLAEAAETCRDRGERLVLLIDGLDEDRGVTTGPEAYSIAALLPEVPPSGMRVIVAGRPNPPVPADVPVGHPLQDPAVVRPLEQSPEARVIANDMLRELTHLLKGSDTERDLLGLVTAAGGGLSLHDLAELTEWADWEIEEHLRAVAGRSFTPRRSAYRSEDRREVYVLGHEELQNTASVRIGPQQLAAYRERLHAWADGYRQRRWPRSTPEYLLRGYFRLLQQDLDVPRMLALATDTYRHNRMLDLTGGDTTSLSEIATLRRLIAGAETADLGALGSLAIHHHALTDRNTEIPTVLVTTWIALGEINRAEALARSITNAPRQAQAMLIVAETVAREGDTEQAETLVRLATTADGRARALAAVARIVAANGEPDRAEALARSVPETTSRAVAMAATAEGVAASGDSVHAGRLIESARALADSVTEPSLRPQAYIALAAAAARNGDRRLAGELVRAISIADLRAQAQGAVAEATAKRGDRPRAETLVQEVEDVGRRMETAAAVAKVFAEAGDLVGAEKLARTIGDPFRRVYALSAVAEAAASAGNIVSAATFALAAEQTITLIQSVYQRAQAVAFAAKAAARAGNGAHAEEMAASLSDGYRRAQAQAAVAEGLAGWGDRDRAEALVREADALGRSLGIRDQRVEAFIALAPALADADDPDLALTLIGRVMRAGNEQRWSAPLAEARTKVAEAVARAGDVKRAERLLKTVRDRQARDRILTHLVETVLRQSGLEAAVELGNRHRKSAGPSLSGTLALAMANAGQVDRAESEIRSIADQEEQARWLAVLAVQLNESGNSEQARTLADEAAGMLNTVTKARKPMPVRARTRTAVARASARTGDTKHALELLHESENMAAVASALVELAQDASGHGDPRKAAKILADADRFVRQAMTTSGDIIHQESLLTSAATLWFHTGDRDAAVGLVRSIATPYVRAKVSTALALEFARVGDIAGAEALARSIIGSTSLADALAGLARVAAPSDARRMVAYLLQLGVWWQWLDLVVRVEPEAIHHIADEYLRSIEAEAETGQTANV